MIREFFFGKIKYTIVVTGLLAVSAATLFYCSRFKDTGSVVINEVCADNFSAYRNDAGEYTDYVELFNMSDSEVSGLYISDSRKELKKFRIDAAIPSNGFYVAAVSKGADSGFGISKDGETIFLSEIQSANTLLSIEVSISIQTISVEKKLNTDSAAMHIPALINPFARRYLISKKTTHAIPTSGHAIANAIRKNPPPTVSPIQIIISVNVTV